jgi:hypothetical protein
MLYTVYQPMSRPWSKYTGLDFYLLHERAQYFCTGEGYLPNKTSFTFKHDMTVVTYTGKASLHVHCTVIRTDLPIMQDDSLHENRTD